MSEVRYMPLPVPKPVWNDDEGGYPDTLKVSFVNGKIRTYRLDPVQQPKPHVISTKELARLFKENTLGYKPKHAKK